MTREAKIERTAEKYAEGNPNAILIYRAFKDGVEYADKHPAKKQSIWHTPDIEPDPESNIIYTCTGYDGLVLQLKYDPEPYYGMKIKWSDVVNNYNIIKWAYSNDIINL